MNKLYQASNRERSISDSADEFIANNRCSARTFRILNLFLKHFGEETETDYLVDTSWQEVAPEEIYFFIDYHLVIDGWHETKLFENVPKFLKRWLRWCHQNGFVDDEQYTDLIISLPIVNQEYLYDKKIFLLNFLYNPPELL